MAQDLEQRLLNAQLPQSVYRLCPNVPVELQQPNFDPVEYVNSQLNNQPFTAEVLNNLINDVDTKIKDIDREIEQIIMQDDQGDIALPDMAQTGQLLQDLAKINEEVAKVQQNTQDFISKLQKFNNARKQIDYLALNVEFCKQFQDLTKETEKYVASFHDNEFIQNVQVQQGLIKKFSIMSLIEQQLSQLQDVQQLSQCFSVFSQFKQQVTLIKPPGQHQHDAFNFWSTYGVKYGYYCALGRQEELYSDISKQIFSEGFAELFNDSPLASQFLVKLNMFMKAHEKYMKDFELMSIDHVLDGRRCYVDLLHQYGQTDMYKDIVTSPDEYKEHNKLFYQCFNEYLIKQLQEKTQKYLSKTTTTEVINTTKILESIEQMMVNDPASKVQPKQLTGSVSKRDDEICQYIVKQMQGYVQTSFLQAAAPQQGAKPRSLHPANFFQNSIVPHMKKLMSFMDFVPKSINLQQAQLINKTYTDIIVGAVLPAIKQRLDFSCYVSGQVEKAIRNFKSNGYANFSELFDGKVQPLISLQTFSCSSMVILDNQELNPDLVQFLCDIVRTVKFFNQFFTEITGSLQIKVSDINEAAQISNTFDFSEQQQYFSTCFEQALISVIIGRFIQHSFCLANIQQRSQTMNAAKEIMLRQVQYIEEQLVQFYDQTDLQMLKMQLFSTFIEQIGGIVIGNVLKDGLSAEDLNNLKKVVEQISQEFSQSDEQNVQKIKQIINIRVMCIENNQLDRNVFKQMVQNFEGGAGWYDEVCLGVRPR